MEQQADSSAPQAHRHKQPRHLTSPRASHHRMQPRAMQDVADVVRAAYERQPPGDAQVQNALLELRFSPGCCRVRIAQQALLLAAHFRGEALGRRKQSRVSRCHAQRHA